MGTLGRLGAALVVACAVVLGSLAGPGTTAARQGLSCASFRSQADAQAVYEANLRNGRDDRFGLDPDGDGVACEDDEAGAGGATTAGPEPLPSPSPAARGSYSFPDPRDADIDGFWQRAFADAGLAYTSPDGLLPVGPVAFRSLCIGGRINPGETVAFYCLADHTIYYDRDVRDWVREEYGDTAWIYVMAHEWGHHVQLLADPASRFLAGPGVELQADCLAGVYLADALDREWLDEDDLDEAWPFVFDSGSPDTHGTGAERVEAFQFGLEGGASACGVDL